MTTETDKSTVEQIKVLDNILENVSFKSNEDINALIKETQDTLSALMDELKRRQQDGLHKDIENLDVYMEEVDSSFANLRKFIEMALKELRG